MKKIYIENDEDLNNQIIDIFASRPEAINIGLPGGRSIIPIIDAFVSLDKLRLKTLNFYLIDERISEDLNSRTLLDNGFQKLIDKGIIDENQLKFPKISGNPETDFNNYSTLMDGILIDISFIGVGEDCHFASLFPDSEVLKSSKMTALVLNSPKPPKQRVTLTLRAFRKSLNVLLFIGDKKTALYNFMNNNMDIHYPVTNLKDTNLIVLIKVDKNE